MILVQISGGRGNQMFQYAAGLSLALKLKTDLVLDTSYYSSQDLRNFELLNDFPVESEVISQAALEEIESKAAGRAKKVFNYLPFRKWSIFHEPHFHFSKKFEFLTDFTFIKGYWQSEKYFKDQVNILRQRFRHVKPLGIQATQFQEQIEKSKNAVSLHIRRGDYITNPVANSVLGPLKLEYYEKAINFIMERFEHVEFFLFSDDSSWVKRNLSVGNSTVVEEVSDGESQHLMKLCRHHIIANSSFSWWPAWLNDQEGKTVVAPKNWFNDKSINAQDLVPPTWYKL